MNILKSMLYFRDIFFNMYILVLIRNVDSLYINGITEDLYNELSRYGYNWLVDFGNDLDKEFPDKEEPEEDDE